MHKILIIDREEPGASLAAVFEREYLPATVEPDSRFALQAVLHNTPTLVILNLPLVGMSVLEMIKGLRGSSARLPLVVLGEDSEAGRAQLLETGADDYLVKPFSARELLARVRALLRRTADPPGRVVRFGGIEADLDRRVVMRDGEEVNFTRIEYDLFIFLLNNAGRVVTREEVLNTVWGYSGSVITRTADMHVMRLRRKLEGDGADARHLETVHGVGYRFLM